jgi:phospholipid transport system substrate-binding protein
LEVKVAPSFSIRKSVLFQSFICATNDLAKCIFIGYNRPVNLGEIIVRKFYFIFMILFLAKDAHANMVSATDAKLDLARQCGSFVNDLAHQAIETINISGLKEEEVMTRFRKILKSGFAMKSMAEFALGRYNRVLTPDQKKDFSNCFSNMLVKLYASNFREYKMAEFSVISVKAKTKTLYLVKSRVVIPGKKNVEIVWSVSTKTGKFKICDATQDGVSIRQIQRAEIQGSIEEKGIEGFMQAFKAKQEN